ncbi:hypothetical protein LSCM1_02297 [Leishmania martiniquensis]|uniref:18S rRNA (guanine(1575)-N(7))-methyltransferase Bud23 C-terminal domain-containing protein n=1 Tax=Leishmania martiniquensis TaxID=1580590 RepID=A0A836GII3_9TRYP|nr:hypothetical protein LSCM1_02297 [Leishmania martiniquensis]
MPAPRPELENPPEVFYNASEARKYTVSTRVRKVQRDMTLRALELLNLPKDEAAAAAGLNCSALLLDIGSGSGLSGDVLTEQGHVWIGVDISRDMLRIAKEDELNYYNTGAAPKAADVEETFLTSSSKARFDTSHVKWGLITSENDEEEEANESSERQGDGRNDDGACGEEPSGAAASSGVPSGPRMVEVLLDDIGSGLPFRPGAFDGCVSISVLQWLCHSTKKGEVPQRRLVALFQSLYNALRRGAKAVFQFYPSDPEQVHMITRAAMKCGFSGGVVVDFPHSARAKKYYLVLQAGQVQGGFVPPPALTCEMADDDAEDSEVDSAYDGEESYGGGEDSDRSDEGLHGGESRKRIRVGGRDAQHHSKRARASSAHGQKRRRKDNRPVTGTREWVLLKKEERRRRGYQTTADSKYTMRQRKPRF